MKRLLIGVILCGACLLPQYAAAEILDLGAVKCKDFAALGKEQIAATIAWLDGYYKEDDAPAIIDFDKLKESAAKLGDYCAKNPDAVVGNAAEDLFGK